MCLILTAWLAHPDYPLVIAANRDEYHAREAAPAQWWTAASHPTEPHPTEPHPNILAGRDLSAGGTWLGLTRDGRFAALTNFRDPERVKAGAPSRGAIVPATLAAAAPVSAQLQAIAGDGARYNGFNLLFGDRDELAVYESAIGRGRLLAPGVYGLSNHLLDTPWPKVVSAKAGLGQALSQLPDETALLQLLRDDRKADDDQLPRTGVNVEWERLLSSAFIRSEDYGTRCSTLVLIDRHGGAHFTERTWDRGGQLAGEARFSFQLAS
jgi:uncharacterized protein with NRDE domain